MATAPPCMKVHKSPQSFCIPFRKDLLSGPAATDADNHKYFDAPALLYQCGMALNSKRDFVNLAIVEETRGLSLAAASDWWLVLTRERATKLGNMKLFLSTKLSAEHAACLDVDNMAVLDVKMQRRFGWGDVRADTSMLVQLRSASKFVTPENCSTQAYHFRHDCAAAAAAEYQFRQPRLPPFLSGADAAVASQTPALATFRGMLALADAKTGDTRALAQLKDAARSGALALEDSQSQDAWDIPLCKSLAFYFEQDAIHVLCLLRFVGVKDLARLSQASLANHHRLKVDVLHHIADCRGRYVPEEAAPSAFGGWFPRFPDEYYDGRAEETDLLESVQVPCRCYTVLLRGASPFMVQVPERTKDDDKNKLMLEEFCLQCPDEEMSFEGFCLKVVHCLYGATVPCPQLDPVLLVQVKALWGLHSGTPALGARQLDFLDQVLGRAEVRRCRVCFKPCERGDVHEMCQASHLVCAQCGKSVPPRKPTNDKVLEFAFYMLGPLPKCEDCEARAVHRNEDIEQLRPGNSKVSRKRPRSSTAASFAGQ